MKIGILGSGRVGQAIAARLAEFNQDVMVGTRSPEKIKKWSAQNPRLKTGSLGEQIQRLLPQTKVVKTLNTVNIGVMINPRTVAGGDHTLFLSGNDQATKDQVGRLLAECSAGAISLTWAISARRAAPKHCC